MKRISRDILIRMSKSLPSDVRDEMAIPSYLHRIPLLQWMAWKRLELVSYHLKRIYNSKGHDGFSILDYGCGTGILFEEFLKFSSNVIGVDLFLDAAQILIQALKLENVTLMQPDQMMSRVPHGSIDVIVASEVLEHISSIDDLLLNFQSLLNSSGHLLVSLPSENYFYRLGRKLAGFSNHYHHSDASSVHDKIMHFGFSPIFISKIPFPGPFSIYWIVDYIRSCYV